MKQKKKKRKRKKKHLTKMMKNWNRLSGIYKARRADCLPAALTVQSIYLEIYPPMWPYLHLSMCCFCCCTKIDAVGFFNASLVASIARHRLAKQYIVGICRIGLYVQRDLSYVHVYSTIMGYIRAFWRQFCAIFSVCASRQVCPKIAR